MLEEGVASAEDIDAAMELGYRHPVGPLRTTDIVGLDVRLGIAEELHAELGARFEPPALLRRLVAEGKLGRKTGEGFYDMGERPMIDILPSYVQGAWWTPGRGAGGRAWCATPRPASPSPGSAPTGLDLGGALEYARTVGQASLGALTFHQRAMLLKQFALALTERKEELYALSTRTGATKADSLGRHRRRHRRAVHLLVEGSPRAAERPGLRRRPRRAALEGRLVPRPAHLHAAARRRGADQRVQLPGVGVAREVRAGVPRRRADARQAGHADRLPRRGVRAHPRRVGAAARGLAAARERQRADPVRPPAPRRPRRLHRQRLDGGDGCAPTTACRPAACASRARPTRSTPRSSAPTPSREPRSSTRTSSSSSPR